MRLAARCEPVSLNGAPDQRRSLLRGCVAIIGLMVIGLWAVNSHRAGPRLVSPLAQARPAPASDMPRLFYSEVNAPTLTLADGRNRRVLSLLNIRHKLQFGEYVWDVKGIARGDTWIMVDLSRQIMSVFRGDHEIGSAPIVYGADNKPTPVGVFPVLQKARMHRSTLYDVEMPFMLRLSWDGVAVHASPVQIGQATHGCIGVPPEFARLMFDQVRVGDLISVSKA
jgi:lipoprotein-anchoring transpeptidase ErfK/SrfK